MPPKDKHHWIRGRLLDRGLKQIDVARAWGGVDGAVVSRFIAKGEPELSISRAESLAKLLGMELPELLARLAEKPKPHAKTVQAHQAKGIKKVPAPRTPYDEEEDITPAKAAAAVNSPTTAPTPTVRNTIAELRMAVDKARAVMPGFKIHVSITYGDGEDDTSDEIAME